MGSFPKSHILAIPFPAQGHMSPMMQLAKRIASAGFTVSYVNIESIHEQMVKNWIPPVNLDIHLESLPCKWSIPNGMDPYCSKNLCGFFDELGTLGAALGDLIDRLSRSEAPVIAIISDYFLPWTQLVADQYGIARVVFWSGAASWACLEYYVPDLISRGHVPPTHADILRGDIINWVPGLMPFTPADIPSYLCRKEGRWLEITLERSPTIRQASWTLVNSFYELEKHTFDVLRSELGEKFVPSGPSFLLDVNDSGPSNVVLRQEDENCIKWLDTQSEGSVLYISFGSIAVLSVEQVEELEHALEGLKQPFLWVIRPELVIGGMPEELYKSFCVRTQNQGYITSWAPQLRVLAHPSVGGFITHCGWNSMLESICNGVPMLGWPLVAEQIWNCKLMVEDWKIGARFSKTKDGFIERTEIERVVKLIIEDEEGREIKKRVKQMSDAGKSAVEEGGSSLNNLQTFLHEMHQLKA